MVSIFLVFIWHPTSFQPQCTHLFQLEHYVKQPSIANIKKLHVEALLYLFSCVREIDGGVLVTGRHLGLCSQQGGDEGRVDQGRLLEL